MRTIFMGTPEFSVPVLDALHARHEVVGVWSQPPRPAGRGKELRKTPVHARAEALGLSVHTPERLRDPADQAQIAALNADVAVVVAYGLILPQVVLDMPVRGCLNIHASLLPRWRGAAPIHRAIMAGDQETGICIIQMEAGLDTGPVLLRCETAIGPVETTAELHDRLAAMGAGTIIEALEQLDRLTPVSQPDEGVTYASKIDKSEARIDWARSSREIDCQIRGLSPFPGAWTQIGAERVKLLRSTVVPGAGSPGEVLAGFTIACGEGAVSITEAQREGKRPMPASEILKGLSLPDRL